MPILVPFLASTGQYCMDTRCTLGVPILVPFLASTGQYCMDTRCVLGVSILVPFWLVLVSIVWILGVL